MLAAHHGHAGIVVDHEEFVPEQHDHRDERVEAHAQRRPPGAGHLSGVPMEVFAQSIRARSPSWALLPTNGCKAMRRAVIVLPSP